MRVILMSDVYLPFLSGVSTVTYTLSKELARFGVDVVLVVPYPHYYLGRVYRENGKRRIVLHPSLPLKKIYSELRFPTRYYDAREFILDGETVYHVHSPMIFGTAVVKNLRNMRDKGEKKFAIVGTFHTKMSDFLLKRLPPKFSKTLTRLLDFYTKHIFRRMDITTTLSNFMKKELEEKLGIDNVITIPNPLNRIYYTPPKHSVDHYFEKLEPQDYFLYLGRISVEKRVDVLAKLFCRKTKFKFVFAGTGPILDELKKIYEGTNCYFLGRVDFQSQKALYRDAIAFVSASDFETQGMVFAEAMAQGTPVITYYKGGQMDYVRHGYNGYTFQKDEQILQLAEKLAKNPDLRQELGENARKTVMRFHPDKLIPKYIRLYEGVLERI